MSNVQVLSIENADYAVPFLDRAIAAVVAMMCALML